MGIYEDVETLKTQMTAVQSASDDSGWIDLPLASGILAYSDNARPRYKKIGNKVIIKGAIKNVLASGVIATLPTGYRPVRTGHSYVQNTTTASNSAKVSRIAIQTNGDIEIESISEGASFGTDRWFPLHTEFVID